MIAPEEKELLDELVEHQPDELAQPSRLQGGPIAEEAIATQVDIYLKRLISIGELLPWKQCIFQVAGIRGGVVGLTLRTIKAPPSARANMGKRPSNTKKTPEQIQEDRERELQRQENRRLREEAKEQRMVDKKERRKEKLKNKRIARLPLTKRPLTKKPPKTLVKLRHPAIEGPIETFEDGE